jgi:hypothetical protein
MEPPPHYASSAPQDSEAEALIQVVAIEPLARRVNAEFRRSTDRLHEDRQLFSQTRVDCVRSRYICHCRGMRRWI